jgi:hypothetical protein
LNPRKKIIILFISIILFSCSKKNKEIKYAKHNIEFLNWKINIPENYVRITFDEYKRVISENYIDTIFISNRIRALENIERNTETYAFFCDNENIENIFIIHFMLNPFHNKNLKNQIAKEIHSINRIKGKEQGYIYEPMENKLINDWLIKIKGKKKFDNENSTYITAYLSKSFRAYVSNENKELDFEKELTE